VEVALMQFVTFDRDQVAAGRVQEQGPRVRVRSAGRLVFNRAAGQFLREQYGAGPQLEVALLFAGENRTVGVRPLLDREMREMPDGQRWPLVAQRSTDWPVGVSAGEFVDHFRLGVGEFEASLLRGPGPRMLTFAAGPAQAGGAYRSPGRGLVAPVVRR
jgi:hypothetical protein